MQNRLRSAVTGLTSQAKRLIPGRDDPVVVTGVDDDPHAEALPPAGPAPEDAELAALDEGEAPPMNLADDVLLMDLLREIDPTPAIPLTGRHEAGFVTLLERLAAATNDDLVNDWRVRRVLDLIGDRLSVAIDPQGITVRGLLRRRHTAWDKIGKLTFNSRYELMRGDAITKLAEDIKQRLMPIPIPGLSWLLRRVVGGISNWLERRVFTPEDIESMKSGAGNALTHIERPGFDVELSGPLLLLSILAPGLSEATEAEARRRGVNVAVEDTGA